MTKLEFLSALRNKLSGLPKEDIDQSIDYYSEIIDDRMEDGVSEEEAVKGIGAIDEIVSSILADTSLPKLVKEKVSPKRALKAWEIVLLILGAPVWLPLLVAAVVVILAVYIVLWAVVVVLYAVVISLGAGSIVGLFGLVAFCLQQDAVQGLLFMGMGLICCGLTILSFHLSNLSAKGIVVLSRKILLGIKRRFIGKETVQ